MDTEAEPTYAPATDAYHAPTRDDEPAYFAWLDWLATRESVMATDNPHALCFNCKHSVRVMTACLYEGAVNHVCIWRKVK